MPLTIYLLQNSTRPCTNLSNIFCNFWFKTKCWIGCCRFYCCHSSQSKIDQLSSYDFIDRIAQRYRCAIRSIKRFYRSYRAGCAIRSIKSSGTLDLLHIFSINLVQNKTITKSQKQLPNAHYQIATTSYHIYSPKKNFSTEVWALSEAQSFSCRGHVACDFGWSKPIEFLEPEARFWLLKIAGDMTPIWGPERPNRWRHWL